MAKNLRIGRSFRTAISTGGILGGGRDARKWYVQRDSGAWEETYSRSPSLTAAKGKLANLRAVQAITRLTPHMSEADAEANTDRFIAQLATFWSYGVHALSIGLQGGNPLTDTSTPARSQGAFTYDQTAGGPSAYNADGTLKASYKARAERVLQAMDEIGLACILGLFYGGQNYVFPGGAASDATALVNAAIDNTCAWLIGLGRRNLIINVANEAGTDPSSRWQARAPWVTDQGCADIIDRVQANFAGTALANIAVGISTRGTTIGTIHRAAETVRLWHANSIAVESKDESATTVLGQTSGPAVTAEDENTDAWPLTAAMLTNERRSLELEFGVAGNSPGTMPDEGFQRYWDSSEQFVWTVGASTDVTTGTDKQKVANYTRGVCEELLLRTGGLPGSW